MATLQILHFPDPRLRHKGHKVEKIDEEIHTLVKNMAEAMYELNGIGISATQVNIQKRLFLMDLSREDEAPNLQVFINPEIISQAGKIESEEGCLSVPGFYDKIIRFETITVQYQDLQNNFHKKECSGLRAICIQHEIDHLNGKVFVEYLSNLKQNYIKKKLKKIFKPE